MSQPKPQQAIPDDVAQYPTNLPSDTFTRAVAVLRGQVGDPKEAAHEVWAVVGYALGKAYSDQSQPAMTASAAASASPVTACPPEEAAAELEKCCNGGDPGKMQAQAESLGSGKWLAIAAALLKALLPLLISV